MGERKPTEGSRLLNSCGLSQQEIGERLGVSHVSVCNWLSGKKLPNNQRRQDIYREFGVSPESWAQPAGLPPLMESVVGVGPPIPPCHQDEQAIPSPVDCSNDIEFLRKQQARLRSIIADPSFDSQPVSTQHRFLKLDLEYSEAIDRSRDLPLVKVLNSRAWQAIRRAIGCALEPYPKASMACFDALAELET